MESYTKDRSSGNPARVNKVGRIGPTVYLTGRMETDMKTIQDFYAPIEGRYAVDRFVVVTENQEK